MPTTPPFSSTNNNDRHNKASDNSDLTDALSETLFNSFDTGYYIGMMSGTSLDGLDAVICQFDQEADTNDHSAMNKIVTTYSKDFPPQLRKVLLALCQPNGVAALDDSDASIITDTADTSAPQSELDWFGWASRAYAEFASEVVIELLKHARIEAADIVAIGCHGQTVRHRPQLGFTLQLVDANIIAERTGISVVTDFRRRDMAVGGQGAPLAPAFHLAQFGAAQAINRIIINLGGIANITVLPAGEPDKVIGYDTGPANNLLDAWYQHQTAQGLISFTEPLFDKNGQWAMTGTVNEALLTQLLLHPYFQKSAPKSTGREDFHLDWLNEQIALVESTNNIQIDAADVQATLTLLTVQSLVQAIHHEAKRLNLVGGELIICGGGAYNTHLLEQLNEALSDWSVLPSTVLGIAPTWVEAMAFAWLARQSIKAEVGNLPVVTGARKAVVLGQMCFG